MGRGLRPPCCLWGWGRTGAWQGQPPRVPRWVQNHPHPKPGDAPSPSCSPQHGAAELQALPQSTLLPQTAWTPHHLLPGAPRSPFPAPNQSPPPWPGAGAALTCWGEPSGSQRVHELPCLPGHRGALRAAEKVTTGRVGGCLVQCSCSHRLLPRQPRRGRGTPQVWVVGL